MRKFNGKKAAAERVRAHPAATRKTGAVLLRKSRLTTFGLHGRLVMPSRPGCGIGDFGLQLEVHGLCILGALRLDVNQSPTK